jgi:diguanylate cyclase (GGDEF)-like protein
LAGALRSEDVVRVLVQAILGSIVCDAAGALVLPRVDSEVPLAVLGASRPLSPGAQRELVRALIAELPEALRPDGDRVQVATIVTESDGIDDDDWAQRETSLLAVREHVSGTVILAGHNEAAFSEETRAVFGILASQGSVALENAYLFARMRELATRDSLTGLYNHGHFFELLDAEISRAERYHQEFAVIMFDHDNRGLKRINDTYGHQAGDQLLRDVARVVEQNVRRADVVARYGGDEFVVLAPQTSREQALVLAERICSRLHDQEFIVADQVEHVTVSVGVTVFHPECGETASTVVARADQGLYQAKERGGDQVCLAE